MKSNDVNWFRPLWRRVTVTAFLVVWCGWEWLWNKDQFWGLLVSAALVYALYSFFYAFPKEGPKDGNDTKPPHSP